MLQNVQKTIILKIDICNGFLKYFFFNYIVVYGVIFDHLRLKESVEYFGTKPKLVLSLDRF